ncbi:MAG: DUF2066 domain-containing protein [Steroidobacteraceae bacterium]
MRRTAITVRNDGPALLAALACVLALLLAEPGRAADVPPYQAVVPLQGNAEADRQASFAAALRAAAVRASGQRDAATNAAIAQAAADPSGYVQQYGTTSGRMLKVGFDAQAMEQLLTRAGLTLWPAERPQTLVLLAAPSAGGGSRVIIAGDASSERGEIERAAQYRGLPLSWPRMAVDVDRARTQLLSGDVDAVAAAASADGARAVLVGVAGGGGVEWVFGHAGRTTRAQGSLQVGVDLAADTLADRYAPASTRGVSTLGIRVGGIGGVRSYAALLEYLHSLSPVKQVAVAQLAEGVVSLEVTMRGDLEQLRRIAALDGRLQPASGTDFVFQP